MSGAPESTRTTSIATEILVCEDAEELDFVGTWEVLGVADRLFPGSFPTRLVSNGAQGYARGTDRGWTRSCRSRSNRALGS